MRNYLVKIVHGNSEYDKWKLNEHQIVKYKPKKQHPNSNKAQIRSRILCIDGISLHYLILELKCAPNYRASFIKVAYRTSVGYGAIKFELIAAKSEILDHLWNEKLTNLVRERCELDHTLSWLSTLGGAFSALGDYSLNCAEIAGKISYHQLQLALRLRDEGVVARCKLYFGLSLIQRRYFKLARRIVYGEFLAAKSALVVDHRLVSMCKGIWCKLQYEHSLHRQCRQLNKLKVC